MESDFASRRFRFPDKLAALLKRASEELFENARHVIARTTDQADVGMAKLTSTYREITDYARGWRLSDPFEGLRSRLKARRGGEKQEPPRFDLTPKEMDRVMALVKKRATDQAENTFAVHPPKKLIAHPEIAEAKNVVEQLEDSVFEVVFQDDTYAMLTLTELMVFIYNLIFLKRQHKELNEMFKFSKMPRNTKIDVTFSFSVNEIMKPEVVKVLLSKIAFSDSPSDDATEPSARDAWGNG